MFSCSFIHRWLALAALCLLLPALTRAATTPAATERGPVRLSLTWYRAANDPSALSERAAEAAWNGWRLQVDPVTGKPWDQLVTLAPANNLSIEGSSVKLLQFAGGTGEDIVTTFPDTFYQYRDQNFFLPLNPFIWRVRRDPATGQPARTTTGAWDYELDATGQRQLLWQPWTELPREVQAMLCRGDDVLGIPEARTNLGFYWRKDVFQQAGLDPERGPETWEEVYQASLRIAASAPAGKTRYGFLIERNVWYLATVAMDHGVEMARPAGEGQGGERWRTGFACEPFYDAIRTLRKMALVRFVVGPENEPIVVELPDEPVDINSRALGTGRWENGQIVFAGRTFAPAEIRRGVAYVHVGLHEFNDAQERRRVCFEDKEVAMFIDYAGAAMRDMVDTFGLGNFGFSPPPAGIPGHRFGGTGGTFGSLNSQMARDPEKARRAWAALAYHASDEFKRVECRKFVNAGMWSDRDPRILALEGYHSVLEQFTPPILEAIRAVEASGRPEPYAPQWQQFSARFLLPAYERALKHKDADWRGEIASAADAIDREWEFAAKDYRRVRGQGWIGAGVVVIFAVVGWLSWLSFRGLTSRYRTDGSSGGEAGGMMRNRFNLRNALLLLLPALGLIALFSYYPIVRGLPMAFMDYRIVGGSEWVGLANFIEVFRSARTYQTLLISLYYLALTIGLGFLAPVVLAILLSEIPRFKYLFRTVYYLPAVVSGVVMALLWKKLLDPKPDGIVNQMLGFVGVAPQGWLTDATQAMPCIVAIGIWGAAGPGTLIYLAALKSVPEELYEAAQIDGAGWLSRLWHITLHYLRPLLVINFVGAVIGAFQASGNIFVLTGGGPNFTTQTFALELFMQAFIFMKFGYATALAWIMAALLMGFTVWQLKILRNVEFRRANAE